MIRYGWPCLYALLIWWLSTGAVLYVVGLPRHTFRTTMAIASIVLLVALAGLMMTSSDTTVSGAYIAFTCALCVWGWHETSFLTGMVTGPRVAPLDPDTHGMARFTAATGTLIHHEIAIALTVPLIALLANDGPNGVGLAAFLVLWLARLSTKLNIFFGVSNLADEFLPAHMRYLSSYFRRRAMNPLFPVTVTAATIATFCLARAAIHAATDAEAAGWSLVAALSGLAVLEHWFLVLPLPTARLWEWGMHDHDAHRTTTDIDETAIRATAGAAAKALTAHI